MGMPDSVMVFDNAGFRTHDSVVRCLEIFGQRKVTIISQRFHNERALYIAAYYGMQAVGYNARDVSMRDNLYNFFREKMARVLMFADLYVFHTKPHLLGRKMLIP